ncbi:MAG: glycosyltransferase family 39 protein [Sphingomonadales bacterium]|nr:glycosyltransferase family 39 protein [Sphingomonadales bacterium]
MYTIGSNGNRLFYAYVLIWSVFGAVQALSTGLHPDEAYYDQYSRSLDWGYFDHPPMIALLIRAGGSLFDGIIGLRLGTVLLQPVFWLLVWRLVRTEAVPPGRQGHLMGILMVSLPMIQLYGFITTPDMPLLTFTALFWLVYRRILLRQGSECVNGFWLTLALTGMAYSKYLGAIQVALALAAHPRLLRQRVWIIASVATFLLLLPHLYWQYRHDFVTFRFHLAHRTEGIRWDYIWQYLPNQLAVFHPFNLVALFMLNWRKRSPTDPLEHAMRWSLMGILIFYGLLSLRGHTEPHWTVSATLPMLWLFVRHAEKRVDFRRFVYRFTAPSLLVVMALRLWLFTDSGNRVARLSRPDDLHAAMARLADGRPALFAGSFQDAALYQFHTRQESGLVATAGVRNTQYDIWKRHAQWQDQSVVVFGAAGPDARWLSVGAKGVGYIIGEHLQSPELLHIQHIKRYPGQHPDSLCIEMLVDNPTDFEMHCVHRDFPFRWVLCAPDHQKTETDTLIALTRPKSLSFAPKQSALVVFELHKRDLPNGRLVAGIQTIFGLQFPPLVEGNEPD